LSDKQFIKVKPEEKFGYFESELLVATHPNHKIVQYGNRCFRSGVLDGGQWSCLLDPDFIT
jgi:hypothetical protein